MKRPAAFTFVALLASPSGSPLAAQSRGYDVDIGVGIAMLSTLPVEKLDHGSVRARAAECRDCDRVTRVVVERERSMLVAYGDLNSVTSATQVALNAYALSNRRRLVLSTCKAMRA